jgi:hypothetical protein
LYNITHQKSTKWKSKLFLTEGQITQVLTDNKQTQQGPETYLIIEPQKKIESVSMKKIHQMIKGEILK